MIDNDNNNLNYNDNKNNNVELVTNICQFDIVHYKYHHHFYFEFVEFFFQKKSNIPIGTQKLH